MARMTEDEIAVVFDAYWKRFDKSLPFPYGVHPSVMAEVAKEALDRGAPIPDDYDWYANLPPGADA